MLTELENALVKNRINFHPVVDFDPGKEKLFPFDLTSANTELGRLDISDTNIFSEYVSSKLKDSGSKYGIGGYDENRTVYRRSKLFDGEEERSVHLGVDIWGPAGTKVYAALGGMVHSFAYNEGFGDYGATIILLHQLDTVSFHNKHRYSSLYEKRKPNNAYFMNFMRYDSQKEEMRKELNLKFAGNISAYLKSVDK